MNNLTFRFPSSSICGVRRMFKDLDEKLKKDPELRKHYQQEKLILDVTELVAELMIREKVGTPDLAEVVGLTDAQIISFLTGDTENVTLRNIADMFTTLNSELVVSSKEYWPETNDRD